MNEFYLVESYLKDKKFSYRINKMNQLILTDFMDMDSILKLIIFLKENNFILFNLIITGLTIIKNDKK